MYLINLKVFHIIKKHQPKVGQIPIGAGGKFWILEHHLLRKEVGSKKFEMKNQFGKKGSNSMR